MAPICKVNVVSAKSGVVFNIRFEDQKQEWTVRGKSWSDIERVLKNVKTQCRQVKRWPQLSRQQKAAMTNRSKQKNVLDKKKKALLDYLQKMLKINEVWKSQAMIQFREGGTPSAKVSPKGAVSPGSANRQGDDAKESFKHELRRSSTQALINNAIKPDNIILEKDARINELLTNLQDMEKKLSAVAEEKEKVLKEGMTHRNLLEDQKKKFIEEKTRLEEDNIRIKEDKDRINMERESLLQKNKELEELKSASNEKAEKNEDLERKLQDQTEQMVEKMSTLQDMKKALTQTENLLNEKHALLDDKRQENRELGKKLQSYTQQVKNLKGLTAELKRQLETQQDSIDAQGEYSEKLDEARKLFKQERFEFGVQLATLHTLAKAAMRDREESEDEIRKLKRDLKHAEKEIDIVKELSKSSFDVRDEAVRTEVKRYRTKIAELEATVETLQAVVDLFSADKKDQPIKMLEREQTITHLKGKVKELELELDKHKEQTEIKVETLQRRHTQTKSMLETQFRNLKIEDSSDERNKNREELFTLQETIENDREKYSTEIIDLQAKVKNLTAKLSSTEEAHARELDVFKSQLSDAEVKKMKRRLSGQTIDPEKELEYAKRTKMLKQAIEKQKKQLSEKSKQIAQLNQDVEDCTFSKLRFIHQSALETEKLRNIIRQLAGAELVSFPPESHLQTPPNLEIQNPLQTYNPRGKPSNSLKNKSDLPFQDYGRSYAEEKSSHNTSALKTNQAYASPKFESEPTAGLMLTNEEPLYNTFGGLDDEDGTDFHFSSDLPKGSNDFD